MRILAFLPLVLFSSAACIKAPRNTSNALNENNSAENEADLVAIAHLINSFYKWVEMLINDKKWTVALLDAQGHAAKLDNAKLATYHTALLKGNLFSKKNYTVTTAIVFAATYF